MKFLIVFVSLVMIVFGGLFSYVFSAAKDQVKIRINYDNLDSGKQKEVDDLMMRWSNMCFVGFLLGICLFIASLFL